MTSNKTFTYLKVPGVMTSLTEFEQSFKVMQKVNWLKGAGHPKLWKPRYL